MNPIPTRFLEEIGTIAYLRRYWEDGNPCKEGWSYHNARVEWARSQVMDDWKLGGESMAVPHEAWPIQCHYCQTPVPKDAPYQILRKRLYKTPQGEEVSAEDLQVGDLYFMRTDFRNKDECMQCDWTNCDKRHLHLILPGKENWDIDGRCSNCDMKSDTTHRCWVRHGDPRQGQSVHVDKQGLTCHAGAGSIVVPGFHGFLHQGKIVSC